MQLPEVERWRIAAELKRLADTGDEAAVEAALDKLPPLSRAACRIAALYAHATGGQYSGELLFSRGGAKVELLLAELLRDARAAEPK